ncbi:MAG: DUF4230 domain-containing protein [Calditrichaeota bacterium]|nr:DUF4230 domain-containing protein [Calditrichota bacterium]
MIKKILFALFQLAVIAIAIFIYAEFFSVNKNEMNKEITKALIQNNSFLIKRELILESIIKKEERGRFWGTDKKALIIAKGKVPYGIDFNQFDASDITINMLTKSIEIRIPYPQLYDVIVSDILVYDVQTGIFSSTDAYLQRIYQTVFAEAKETLRSEAGKQFNSKINTEIKNELLLSLSQIIAAVYGDFNINLVYKQRTDQSPTRND